MKKSTQLGYQKVSVPVMVALLLSDRYICKLRAVQIGELKKIDNTSKKYQTVAPPQREYVMGLYQDVILNNKSFTNYIINNNIKLNNKPQHIGLQKFNQLTNLTN